MKKFIILFIVMSILLISCSMDPTPPSSGQTGIFAEEPVWDPDFNYAGGDENTSFAK